MFDKCFVETSCREEWKQQEGCETAQVRSDRSKACGIEGFIDVDEVIEAQGEKITNSLQGGSHTADRIRKARKREAKQPIKGGNAQCVSHHRQYPFQEDARCLHG